MNITYDSKKNEINIQLRDLSFDRVAEIDWLSAQIRDVTELHHKEERFRAWGLIDGRLYIVIFTSRRNSMRVISFRKANSREVKKYEKEIDTEEAESLLD